MQGNKGGANVVLETVLCVLSQFSLRTGFAELRQYEAGQILGGQMRLDVGQ
jgi:hypothetical protein